MAVTTTKFQTYQLYAGASTAGRAQINHANSATGAFKVTFHASAMTKNNNFSAVSQLTSEISAANYVIGGVGLANITFTIAASGTATWDADDVIVTASGTPISAAFAVVHYASGRATAADAPLMFWIDFGQTETAGTGTTFQIQWAADGIVQIK